MASAAHIRFVLGSTPRELRDIDPTTTVLDHLREVERRTGTKEGCAEGDCGACTVLLGELVGPRVRYRAVNACILFLPALHGRQLLTIEDLRAPDGSLHPVQQAMIDHHGSQCGFCTPGIAMSLAALAADGTRPTRERLDAALAGNLCRCTGYRPIVAAARAALGTADPLAERAREAAGPLRRLGPRRPLDLRHGAQRWLAPTTLGALARLVLHHPRATLVAGATDLGPLVAKQRRTLGTVIDVGRVPELGRVRRGRTHVEIGAAVTWAVAEAALADVHPDLGELVRRFGGVQIRNVATIGGNIATASPVGDALPALVALGASVVLRRGARVRERPVDGFVTAHRRTALARGELIERIRVPRLPRGRRFAFYKVSKRWDEDIAAVSAALSLTIDGGRVRDACLCYGGMAATPRRAKAAEQALTGREWTRVTVDAAAAALAHDLAPVDDVRAGAAYRMRVAGNLLRRFHLETTAPDVATRVFEPVR